MATNKPANQRKTIHIQCLIRSDNEKFGLGFSIEHGGRDGFIDDLYLVPAARGAGHGRALLDFAVGEAAKLGIRMLHLEVEPGNRRARGLYRQNGFSESKRRLMSRRLAPAATRD
jgi:ribosomal protein S18 acetylase RimI-like enzyme